MRIISKEKDFYDHGMIYGIDPKLVWDRKTTFDPYTVLTKDQKSNLMPTEYYSKWEKNTSRSVVSKMYIFLINGLVKNFWKVGDKLLDSEPAGIRKDWYYSNYEKTGSEKYMAFAKEHKSPIIGFGFAIRPVKSDSDHIVADTYTYHYDGILPENGIIYNANLKKLGLAQFFDPVQLFQEISNFMLALNEPDLVELNNSERTVKAGFDLKSSFRHRM